jgi:hypothetical protein
MFIKPCHNEQTSEFRRFGKAMDQGGIVCLTLRAYPNNHFCHPKHIFVILSIAKDLDNRG